MAPIRPATLRDAEAILAIYAPYVENTAVSFEYEVPSLRAFEQRMEGIMAFYPYLVWEEEGRILGYAYAHRHQERKAYQWNAELSIYLHPDATHRGIGTALCRALLELLRLQGIKTAYSCVTVPNAASEALHAKMGFSPAGIWHNSGFKLGAWRDVGWFQKALCPYEENPRDPISIHNLPQETVAAVLSHWGERHDS
ncbi:MAG: N-acetyltransferase [Ruminococcaceae bacterium]|nr:N-acetyltransferase [Oscillospiraceae bacterium]